MTNSELISWARREAARLRDTDYPNSADKLDALATALEGTAAAERVAIWADLEAARTIGCDVLPMCEVTRVIAARSRAGTMSEKCMQASDNEPVREQTTTCDLKVGAFYWVVPVLDPDTDEEWEHGTQPARFAGLNDTGGQLWHCLNMEGVSDWPMRSIGAQIAR